MKFILNKEELDKNSAREEKQVVNEKEDLYSEPDSQEIKLSANLRLSHDMNNEEHIKRLQFYAKHNPTLLADMERWN